MSAMRGSLSQFAMQRRVQTCPRCQGESERVRGAGASPNLSGMLRRSVPAWRTRLGSPRHPGHVRNGPGIMDTFGLATAMQSRTDSTQHRIRAGLAPASRSRTDSPQRRGLGRVRTARAGPNVFEMPGESKRVHNAGASPSESAMTGIVQRYRQCQGESGRVRDAGLTLRC